MHPLLRLATGVEDTPQRFRQFHRLVRRALEAPDFSAERTALAIEVLYALDDLQLDDESASAFRVEWLDAMTSSVDSAVLHEHRALEQLAQEGLHLSRQAWTVRDVHFDGLPFLKLQRLRPSTDDSDRPLRLPVSTTGSLNSCVNTAIKAVRDDRLKTWDSANCLAVLRSIAILSVHESEQKRSFFQPKERKDYFLGVCQGLWLEVAKQLASTREAKDHECFWDGSLQRVLALHISGIAFVDQTVTSEQSEIYRVSAAILAEPDPPTGESKAGTLLVVRGPIPAASNKEDAETIRTYKPLLIPQPVAVMPSHREVDAVLTALAKEFPWATNVVGELGSMLRARSFFGVKELCLSPVLIVGYPGAGKSRFIRRVAEHLKLPYLPLPLGGRTDTKLISGTSRGWAGGEPTPLLRLMLQHKSASGLVLLDEIDKAVVTDSNSPPVTSVLLGLMEPETAARWHDGFLQTTCNFTRLSFWATANSLKTMPAALLSRFTVLYMPEPRPEDMQVLVQGITEDIAREWRLPLGVLPLAPQAMYEGARLNARELRRMVMQFLSEWSAENLRPERLH
ncbi:AAA family ATPase [Hydrogenophaga sp.]|uniref:AAA family ATPase n=1 Tax=Hydrogenophaga sp. TaxID=1904254 RepID=UPI002728BB2A|nr:AAA family ATPase [Hydrogenophaga sp.]MDO8903229.1 AAA family ATPase [Hydrogenophaga sp.]